VRAVGPRRHWLCSSPTCGGTRRPSPGHRVRTRTRFSEQAPGVGPNRNVPPSPQTTRRCRSSGGLARHLVVSTNPKRLGPPPAAARAAGARRRSGGKPDWVRGAAAGRPHLPQKMGVRAISFCLLVQLLTALERLAGPRFQIGQFARELQAGPLLAAAPEGISAEGRGDSTEGADAESQHKMRAHDGAEAHSGPAGKRTERSAAPGLPVAAGGTAQGPG
jgi:hypothetical protein